ncbi:MAG: hypothetical protein II341_07030, partial [Oscillospiraceae bacterium]|nr:hypothetical protein [Oscillospiraceae bacterium]
MTDEMTESDGADVGCGYPYDEDEIIRLISRTVPVSEIPAKLSVSEIKGMRSEAEDSAALHPSVRFKMPRFLQGGVTGADSGSATHKFLLFCDFERVATHDGFED